MEIIIDGKKMSATDAMNTLAKEAELAKKAVEEKAEAEAKKAKAANDEKATQIKQRISDIDNDIRALKKQYRDVKAQIQDEINKKEAEQEALEKELRGLQIFILWA